jgi:microcystin-dependent protein
MTDPFLGEIKIVPYNYAPRNWTFCDGQLLNISANTALFLLLGTTYKNSVPLSPDDKIGGTVFNLPDLRGRVPIGEGTGPGLTFRRLGECGGQETVQLDIDEIPSHNHP